MLITPFKWVSVLINRKILHQMLTRNVQKGLRPLILNYHIFLKLYQLFLKSEDILKFVKTLGKCLILSDIFLYDFCQKRFEVKEFVLCGHCSCSSLYQINNFEPPAKLFAVEIKLLFLLLKSLVLFFKCWKSYWDLLCHCFH